MVLLTMYRHCLHQALVLLLSSLISAQVLFQPQNEATSRQVIKSTPLNITNLHNNRGFGRKIGDANFDSFNGSS
jgi:hypothetical protein